ncbi:MAG: O-antigen ligase family protein [Deltaproteobacteria bacterium]|nr:O-antigen ligase family protein [Deltaproteobacteria bacterium]
MSAPRAPVWEARLSRAGSWAAALLAWSLPCSIFGMQAAVVAGTAVLIGLLLLRRRWAPSPMDFAFGFLLAAIGLSLLLAPRPVPSFRAATSFWVILAFFVAYHLADASALRRGLIGAVGLACGVACFAVFQTLTGSYPLGPWLHPGIAKLIEPAPGTPGFYGAVGLFFSRLTLAHSLLFPLCWVAGWILEPVGWRRRFALLVAAGLLAAGLLSTWTRAAPLAAACALSVLAVLRLPAGKWRRAGLALLLLLAAGALVLLPRLLPERFDRSFAGKHDWGRLAIWHSALDLAAEQPLTGIGYGGFQRDVGRLTELRRVQSGMERFKGTLAWAHSNLLSFLAECGALGAVALCLLFAAYFRAAAGVSRARGRDPWLRGFVRGSAAAACAFLVVGLFHDPFFDGEVIFALYFTMGASLACARIGSQPEAP